MDSFNRDIFIVTNVQVGECNLFISKALLNNYIPLDNLGYLEIAEEAIDSNWGYSVEESFKQFFIDKGLDPNRYSSRSMNYEPSEICLEAFRRMLGVAGSNTTCAQYKVL